MQTATAPTQYHVVESCSTARPGGRGSEGLAPGGSSNFHPPTAMCVCRCRWLTMEPPSVLQRGDWEWMIAEAEATSCERGARPAQARAMYAPRTPMPRAHCCLDACLPAITLATMALFVTHSSSQAEAGGPPWPRRRDRGGGCHSRLQASMHRFCNPHRPASRIRFQRTAAALLLPHFRGDC